MIKAYLVPSLKTIIATLVGALLTAVLYEGYYYLQVLRWVDAIRINQAIQQAAQQQAPPGK